ncbi:glycosyltransferase 9 family protein [Lysobacter gummosus]|nr:glycosyltransferase 9 family protein [Lysobacter gummosus]
MRALRRALRERPLPGGRFDVLLQMQVAARANLLSAFIPAERRVGYDRSRSKDLHGLFVNERIPDRPGIHVLDAIGSFCEPLGLRQTEVIWDLPVPEEAREWARAQWPLDTVPTLLISPCSSHTLRNWRPERYAAVADHAAQRGWRVVMCGGRSQLERDTTDAIVAAMKHPALDLVGKDTLKQLPALLERGQLLMTPDSGPMHIANAMGTKVLGLHAASNPARSGPYSDLRYCADRYDDAARKYLGKSASEIAWGTKIEHDGVMDLITVDDGIAAFERYVADHPAV